MRLNTKSLRCVSRKPALESTCSIQLTVLSFGCSSGPAVVKEYSMMLGNPESV